MSAKVIIEDETVQNEEEMPVFPDEDAEINLVTEEEGEDKDEDEDVVEGEDEEADLYEVDDDAIAFLEEKLKDSERTITGLKRRQIDRVKAVAAFLDTVWTDLITKNNANVNATANANANGSASTLGRLFLEFAK